MRLRPAFFLTMGVVATTLFSAAWLAAQSDRAEAQTNPFGAQPAAVAAGRAIFAASCQSCHAQGATASAFFFRRRGAPTCRATSAPGSPQRRRRAPACACRSTSTRRAFCETWFASGAGHLLRRIVGQQTSRAYGRVCAA